MPSLLVWQASYSESNFAAKMTMKRLRSRAAVIAVAAVVPCVPAVNGDEPGDDAAVCKERRHRRICKISSQSHLLVAMRARVAYWRRKALASKQLCKDVVKTLVARTSIRRETKRDCKHARFHRLSIEGGLKIRMCQIMGFMSSVDQVSMNDWRTAK